MDKKKTKNPTGIICGTIAFPISNSFSEYISTKFGTVRIIEGKFSGKDIIAIDRHQGNTPPHKINHRANLMALKIKGVKEIIGINSCGSLKKKIRPGAIAIPEDYFSPFGEHSIYDEKIVHIVPSLSKKLMNGLAKAAKKSKNALVMKAVYAQTIGPRLETRAEVKFLSEFADLVGMTMASEATIAKELGIEYASLCSVDNYANGIGKELDFAKIRENSEKNSEKIIKIAGNFLKG